MISIFNINEMGRYYNYFEKDVIIYIEGEDLENGDVLLLGYAEDDNTLVLNLNTGLKGVKQAEELYKKLNETYNFLWLAQKIKNHLYY